MMHQAEATNLLCAAVRTLGEDKLKEMLPVPFVLHQISDHSTGRHIYMAAKSEGLPWVHVWAGSVWHSSRYLFNDQINPPGIQKGCEWATEALSAYFDAVKDAHLAAVESRKANDAARSLAAEAERNAAQNAYAALVRV